MMRAQPRTTRERSPWALISILAAILLFGLFWIWQYPAYAPAPTPTPQPVQSVRTPAPEPVSVADLEASAVNIVIPSFEKAL